MYSVEDVLEHFGIPGMKWGKRRKQSGSRSNKSTTKRVKGPYATKKKKSEVSDDHREKQGLKKKRVSEMSNAELKKLNERMQLEKQYKELSRSQMAPGKKFVLDVLGNAGKQAITNFIAKEMTKGIEEAFKKPAK